MEKIHLVFMRDVLKEAISKGLSDYKQYKLEALLGCVRDEIDRLDAEVLCVCGNPVVFCACAEEQFGGVK